MPLTTRLQNMDLHSSILKGLSDHEALAFNAFSRVCADQGLLTRPINLNDNDVPSGLNDDATLLFVSPPALP
jgi:hypothetical protein